MKIGVQGLNSTPSEWLGFVGVLLVVGSHFFKLSTISFKSMIKTTKNPSRGFSHAGNFWCGVLFSQRGQVFCNLRVPSFDPL